MEKIRKNTGRIGVLCSGGDAPGMNACIRSVVRTAYRYKAEVIGIRNGFHGMIADDVVPLSLRSVGNIIQRGGTILGTSRSKEFFTREGRKKAYKNLEALGVDQLVVLGGDGSMNGAAELSKEYSVKVVGVPCTIDNDLDGTDFSIGFHTAVETAVQSIDKIRDTADSHGRVFLIEVMGKNTGHIALETALACGAEYAVVPEVRFKLSALVKKIEAGVGRGKTGSIVIVSEKAKPGYVLELAELLAPKISVDVRTMILGHLQRGGSPESFDRNLASRFGAMAVELLQKSKTRVMTGIRCDRMQAVPFSHIVGRKKPAATDVLELIDSLSV